MTVIPMPRPVELIPPQQQALWGWPAVVNFFLGGVGAGGYVVAVLASGFERSPGLTAATWLGPALVLLGFGAVAIEAGRPFRGPRVLWRIRTSWMSRELWIGGVLALLAAADLLFPLRLHRSQALVAAVGLVLAQGYILRRSRGVSAWDVPVMPLVFLGSALVSGAGLYFVIEAAGGRAAGPPVVIAVLLVLAAGAALWARYLWWSREEGFAAAVRALTRPRAVLAVLVGGHALPFLLAGVALGFGTAAAPVLGAAGALMIGGQLYAKAALILEAGRLRPITLANVQLGRRSS